MKTVVRLKQTRIIQIFHKPSNSIKDIDHVSAANAGYLLLAQVEKFKVLKFDCWI
jgi:hypothetical protein